MMLSIRIYPKPTAMKVDFKLGKVAMGASRCVANLLVLVVSSQVYHLPVLMNSAVPGVLLLAQPVEFLIFRTGSYASLHFPTAISAKPTPASLISLPGFFRISSVFSV